MVRWIPIVLASCSSLAGYTEVKPQIEDFDEIVDTVEESVIDSDSIWDTGTSGDTSEAKKELEQNTQEFVCREKPCVLRRLFVSS